MTNDEANGGRSEAHSGGSNGMATSAAEFIGAPVSGRAQPLTEVQAMGLTVDQRRRAITTFLRSVPCTDAAPAPLGHGRALADFFEWEVASGRIADDGGSSWWSLTNGLLIDDLSAAHRQVTGSGRPASDGPDRVVGWSRFLTSSGDPTGWFWWAHQGSLDRATASARSWLDQECPHEQAFIAIVLSVVAAAADQLEPTDTDRLARLAARSYPDHYPATADDVHRLNDRLRTRLIH